MKIRKPVTVSIIFIIIALLSGCHLEQGKIYFDELRLDPITVYKMSPFERAIYCLSEAHIPKDQAFEDLFQRTTAVVEEQPETADWSEVVCLSLSDEASIEHMQKTINTLQLVLAVQPRESHPARGFKKILEQRLALYERIDDGLHNLSKEQQERDLLALDYEAEIKELMLEIRNQREKIKTLDQQVQKLKEVELMLTPKK